MKTLGHRLALRLEALAGSETAGQFVRFVGVGLANTLIGCAVYLVFVHYVNHTLAYGLAFLVTVSCAAALHARVTYGVPLRASSATLTVLFYLVSYLANAGVLELAVRGLGIDKRLAILAVVAMSVPVTFIVTRIIFKGFR